MRLKLIASDLDGTLFTDKKEITARTQAALERAAALGIDFVPATGRAFAAVPEVIRTLPGVRYVITSNGSAIYDVKRQKPVYVCKMTPESVDAIIELPGLAQAAELRRAAGALKSSGSGRGGRPEPVFVPGEGAGFAEASEIQQASGLAQPSGIRQAGEKAPARFLVSGDERYAVEGFTDGVPYADARYVARPQQFGADGYGVGYVKSTRKPVADIRAFLRAHRDCLDGMAFVSADPEVLSQCLDVLVRHVPKIMATSSFPHLLEIGHSDSGKGRTLQKLMEMLSVSPEEAAAFGDAHNDLEMIRAVRYGVAVGNATEDCKEAAFFVTDTNEAEGVAKAIERLLC